MLDILRSQKSAAHTAGFCFKQTNWIHCWSLAAFGQRSSENTVLGNVHLQFCSENYLLPQGELFQDHGRDWCGLLKCHTQQQTPLLRAADISTQ